MADSKDAPEDQLQALLSAVYGPDEASARDELVQSALKRLEATHRHAAMALRNFESMGTVEARTPGTASPARNRKVREPSATEKPAAASSPSASSPSSVSEPRPPATAAAALQSQPQQPAAASSPGQAAPRTEPAPRPKLAPARVVQVSLVHARAPLEIHSGQGQTIDFDGN